MIEVAQDLLLILRSWSMSTKGLCISVIFFSRTFRQQSNGRNNLFSNTIYIKLQWHSFGRFPLGFLLRLHCSGRGLRMQRPCSGWSKRKVNKSTDCHNWQNILFFFVLTFLDYLHFNNATRQHFVMWGCASIIQILQAVWDWLFETLL